MSTFLLAATNAWLLAGWTMVHFIWLGTVVALAALLFRLLLRRASANVRYLFSVACLLVLAILPIAIATVVPFRSGSPAVSRVEPDRGEGLLSRINSNSPSVGESSRRETKSAPIANPDDSRSKELNKREPIDLTGQQSIQATSPTAPTGLRAQPVESTPGSNSPERITARPSTPDNPSYAIFWLNASVRYLPWLWLIGTPITFAITATGLVGTRRLRRASRPITDGPIAEVLARLAAAMNIGKRVTVAVCDRIAAPVLIGIIRPIILLPPAALTGYTPDEIEMVLLHELAHVRRWDNLVNLLQRLVESLLFFHPAVWLVSSWVRREREACCDAVVVARTNHPHAYAELLVALAAQMPRSVLFHPVASSAMAASPLRARIRRILGVDDDPMLISGKSFALILGTLLLTVTLTALYAPSIGRADEKAKPAKQPAEQASDDAINLLRRFGIDPTKKLSLEDAKKMAELFDIIPLVNPVETKSYQIPSAKQIALNSALDRLENGPLRKHIQFKRKWDDKHTSLEITATRLAIAGFFDPLIQDLSSSNAGSPEHSTDNSSKRAENNDEKTQTNLKSDGALEPVSTHLRFTLKRNESGQTQLSSNGKPIDEKSLRALIPRDKKQLDKVTVIIIADKSIKYAEVMKVIDLLESLGIKKLSLDTRHVESEDTSISATQGPSAIRPSEAKEQVFATLPDVSDGQKHLEAYMKAMAEAEEKNLRLRYERKDGKILLFASPQSSEKDWPAVLGEPLRKERVIAERAWERLGLKLVPLTPLEVDYRTQSGRKTLGLRIVGGDLPKGLPLWSVLTKVDGKDIADMDDLLVWLETGDHAGMTSPVRCYAWVGEKEYLFEAKPPSYGIVVISPEAAEAAAEHSRPAPTKKEFPSLEDQKLADLAWKRLQLELEPLDKGDLRRVKALGYEGGVKITEIGEVKTQQTDLYLDDILVGLHVWPTASMKDVAKILERDDLAELTPLKFYIVHAEQYSDTSGGHPTIDEVHTGRISVTLPKGRSVSDGQSEGNQQTDPFQHTHMRQPRPTAVVAAEQLMKLASEQVEAAMQAKQAALAKRQHAKEHDAVEAAKRVLEVADRNLEEAKRSFENAKRQSEELQRQNHAPPSNTPPPARNPLNKPMGQSPPKLRMYIFYSPNSEPAIKTKFAAESLIKQLPGVELVAIDVSREPDKAKSLAIVNVPTCLIVRVRDGEVLRRLVGLQDEKQLHKEIDGAFSIDSSTRSEAPGDGREAGSKSDLRYDGQTFDEWRNAWLQGSPDSSRQLKALDALEAFAAAGLQSDANNAIEFGVYSDSLDVAQRTREYLHTLPKSDAAPIVDRLLAVLKSDLSRDRRIRAMRALAAIGPNAAPALPALQALLPEKNPRQRIAAAAAIKMIVGKDQYQKPVADAIGEELGITVVQTTTGVWGALPRDNRVGADVFNNFTEDVIKEQERLFPTDHDKQQK